MTPTLHTTTQARPDYWVASLKGFLGTDRPPVEHCELCNEEIGAEHAHLIEPGSHHMLCACQPCALLFASPEAKHYRRIPRRVKRLREFELTDAQWDAFLIPINLAFFFNSGTENRVVAMYPGPAGTTESALDLEAWADMAAANPSLDGLEADVEALLVNRVAGAREYYQLPIDRCYQLVGTIRNHWHGLSGGDEVRTAIQTFFEHLRIETGDREAQHA